MLYELKSEAAADNKNILPHNRYSMFNNENKTNEITNNKDTTWHSG